MVVFSSVMTVLYSRQTAARGDEQRADAARSDEIEATGARLKAAEQQTPGPLDPAALAVVRRCVVQAVAQRRLDEQVQQSIPTTLPTPWPTAFPTAIPLNPGVKVTTLPSGFTIDTIPDLAVCEEAAKYLTRTGACAVSARSSTS